MSDWIQAAAMFLVLFLLAFRPFDLVERFVDFVIDLGRNW